VLYNVGTYRLLGGEKFHQLLAVSALRSAYEGGNHMNDLGARSAKEKHKSSYRNFTAFK